MRTMCDAREVLRGSQQIESQICLQKTSFPLPLHWHVPWITCHSSRRICIDNIRSIITNTSKGRKLYQRACVLGIEFPVPGLEDVFQGPKHDWIKPSPAYCLRIIAEAKNINDILRVTLMFLSVSRAPVARKARSILCSILEYFL